MPQLLDWLRTAAPDVLALQETKLPEENFPAAELAQAGYQSVWSGQKTYNGVATLARSELSNVLCDMPGYDDPQRRILAADVGGVRVINLYVPNGQSVGSDKFLYKLGWLRALRRWLREEIATHERLLVLGDFNIAPEDRDVHDPIAWVGSVLVSPEEREALQAVMGLGLIDLFRRFEQPPRSYSWWDYRAGAVQKNNGLRIDLLLASQALAEVCIACTIDRAPRLVERASDHTPVMATFDI